ncbi:flagellar basal-body rod protein FlgG [Rhodocaloribacter litoris]|uniref:flagellar basal-body rod protein FlgG n=1 Tax=Rhodocaloribacter litoris TaxID=2558931 RepID=UPI00141EF38C|nr:flagellar basal-body rod protein FlgG [Rhodocaloribacter litoris]QXD16013.1 flagellar basal-body rod protein FlgG [Rhodocaloribacter litoris]
MLRAIRTAATGMSAQQAGVDNIANNLANANTVGYKQSKIVFHDLLYQTIQAGSEGEAQGVQPATMQMGHGATAIATVRNFTQGSLIETGNALDVAINGDGFLQVRRPDGTVAYTRDGTLTRNAEGMLVTQSGLPLEPDIAIPENTVEIHISQDGLVSVRLQNEPDMVEVGQLELARFVNPAGLNPIGGNLYEQTQASGEPTIGTPGQDGLGTLMQGYLEAANVDVVQEMVNLITAQRTYELNSKMVTTGEEMLQIANNMKR